MDNSNKIIKKDDLIRIYDNQKKTQLQKDDELKFEVGGYCQPKQNDSNTPILLYLQEKYFDEEDSTKEVGFITFAVNPITLEKDVDWSWRGGKKTFKELENNYVPIKNADSISRYAQLLLEGYEFEDLEESADETSLMSLKSKDTLVILKEQTEKAVEIANKIKTQAQLIVNFQRSQLEAKISAFNNKISVMRKEIEKFEYVITTIEIYAGIKEDIITLKEGDPASADCPVVLHQACLFMDEEFALIDDDFDYSKEKHFNSWLVKDNHFKELLPEEKSMLVCKPRRNDKDYKVDSSLVNFLLNKPNHRTIFLIRNGERLYKLESDNISVDDRLFPNKNEFQDILDKENGVKGEVWERDKNHSKSTSFRKLYTRIIFLIQGLLDRSEVFTPHSVDVNLLKSPTVDNNKLILRYELDNILGDGHPSYEEWVEKLNEKLHEGKRIILCNYDFSKDEDFVRYYANKWSIPNFPSRGIYCLEKSPYAKEKEKNPEYHHWKTQPFMIRYFPDGVQKNWTDVWGDEHSSNRVSILIDPKRYPRYGILNYDDITLEDIDYYLNSRLHRNKYFQFVYSLKKAKELYLKEQALEDEFVKMMVGIFQQEKVVLKEGYTYEEIIKIAIKEFKDSLKWKRSIVDKSKETFFILKEKILGYDFKKKYIQSIG